MKTLIAGIVAIILLGGGYLALDKTNTAAPTSYGALSSPDIASPYLGFGGVRRWAGSTGLITGAATVCSIQSPAATSTLVSAGIQFTLASSSSQLIEFGKGATATATTTSFGTYTVGAGAQASVDTMTTSTSTVVFSPNTYFNVNFAGGGAGSAPVGTCHAVWEQF
jgi:hypothetical protein